MSNRFLTPALAAWLNRIAPYILAALLITNFVYVTSGALHYPLSHVDVWANWFYKAKALYVHEGSLAFLTNWQGEFAHPQYPIALPLLFYGIYLLNGGINEVVPSLLSPALYAAVIILCFVTLRLLRFSINQSLLFMFIYSMLSPVFAQGGRYHAGMPDLYIAVLCWLIFIFLILSQKKVEYSWVIVPLVIIASLIKTEGVLLSIALLFTKETKSVKVYQILLATSGYIYWNLLQRQLGIPSSYNLSLPTVPILLSRTVSTIVQAVRELFFNIKNWYIFWWLFVLGLATTINQRTILKRYLPFALFLGIFLLLYSVSTIPIDGYVTSSLDRLLLQISPFWFVPFAQHYKTIIFKD